MPPSPSFQSRKNIAANPTIVFPKHLAFLEQNRNKSGAILSCLKLVLRVYAVRISEEDDDFPSMESVTSQSKIDTIYQSKTKKGNESTCRWKNMHIWDKKGIRKICFELLDLKDAVENLCGDTHTKYLEFLRLYDEVFETKHELNELQKHISVQGILVQDLLSGVCQELEEWSRVSVEWAFQEALAEHGSTSLPETRRRNARQKKAVNIFPRPTAGPLRPIVHESQIR